jgi:hypothetical protein
VRLSLRPREVATLMFDLELGRQVPRALAAAGRAAGG